ncbi:hypothetical protein, partial [Streptomyces coeruleoprunus]|uniref:hypothetical protein n=1 Tax=Streptomyces coeruleoprunus TaxID=285563 RepID=UPI003CD07075
MPHHVADHQRDPLAGQRDDVVPVAADLGDPTARHVPVRHPHVRAGRRRAGQQGALERERDVLDAAVQAGVVQAERRAGAQLGREARSSSVKA